MSKIGLGACLLAGCLFVMTGCTSSSTQKQDNSSAWSAEQEKALNDPMNYRAKMNRTDISGGELNNFDRRGFDEDMKAWTLD
ncbi:MAG: hypothetical protein IT448_04045 [Phycisphaerales bacterium]|nr:hypothetical protein [Phycisphaerales bacterium]